MKFGFMAALGVASVGLIASSASAVTITTFTPGMPQFQVAGPGAGPGGVGPVSATIGRSGIAAGDYIDIYEFTIDQLGFGSGTVTTSLAGGPVGGDTDLNIEYVKVNGLLATDVMGQGEFEFWGINNVPIFHGLLNTIEVKFTSFGEASYGGNATFLPIPEAETWAMMIAGFGLVGVAMRNKRRAIKTTNA